MARLKRDSKGYGNVDNNVSRMPVFLRNNSKNSFFLFSSFPFRKWFLEKLKPEGTAFRVTVLHVTRFFPNEMNPCPCWVLLSMLAHLAARFIGGSFPVCPALSLHVVSLNLFCAFLHWMLFSLGSFSIIPASLDSETPASAGWWQGLW